MDGQTGRFVAYAFDNFHGHRQFVSNGWIKGKLILSTQSVSGTTIFFEHFIYEFVSDKQFKMTYVTERSEGYERGKARDDALTKL